MNYELKWVDQLETGIELITKDVFDVVLLDLSLPDSHGMETIIGFREQAPAIPIVVLTGLDDEQVAINAVQHGAQDYLIKGQVNSSVIMRSMRYAIERHRLQDELYNLSIIDELTSLYNRRGFFNQAQQFMNTNAQEGKWLLFDCCRFGRHETNQRYLWSSYGGLGLNGYSEYFERSFPRFRYYCPYGWR